MEGTFFNVNGQWISQEALIAKRKQESEAGEVKSLEVTASEILSEGEENFLEQAKIDLIEEKELSRDEIKALLTEKGIEFKGNASTESLKQLIEVQ